MAAPHSGLRCLRAHFCEFYFAYSGSVILLSTERNIFCFNTVKTLPKEACQHFYSWISGLKLVRFKQPLLYVYQSKWDLEEFTH